MIYTPLTRKAMSLAYAAHHGHTESDGVPYVFHPLHLAEQMRSEYTERLAKAKEEAAEIVGSATRRATVRSEEILRESSQQAAAMMKKAENTIEQERRKAMNELKDEVASLSVMIASRVVERDVKEADHERFIEEFIDKVG